MVTAIAEATQYVHSNTASAQTIVTSQLKNIGITSSSEDEQLFDYYRQTAETYPTQSAFTATAGLLNSVVPVTLTYSKFVDSSFADDAFKKLGLTVPGS
jgi:ABC-type nitrate/sulfonate/bicarbonate transport system substrate-binding protein